MINFLLCFLLLFGLVEELPAENRLTSNIFLVLDVSGSMRGAEIQRLTETTVEIAQMPVDAFNIAAITFADMPSRWNPPPQKKAPTGWAEFPSAENKNLLISWLGCFLNNSHGTQILPALEIALREPVNELSIIIISDGAYDEEWELVRDAILVNQKRREDNGLRPAVIMAIRSNINEFYRRKMEELGKVGGGGSYKVD